MAVADLVLDLWVDPPTQAKTTLRAYMSRLRATALGPWLHGGRSGYRLVDDSALHVDLWELEDAVRSPLSSDLGHARSLLSRWRGAPLEESESRLSSVRLETECAGESMQCDSRAPDSTSMRGVMRTH